MALTASAAWWFLPFVLPICFYVSFTDMRMMRITNQAVMALAIVFLIIGLIALPLPVYGARLLQLLIVLLVGIVLNAAGVMGAGDAKFMAAAAPFIARDDTYLVIALLASTVLAAFVTHRLAKWTPLRRMAPDWDSWTVGKKFPMGFALGGTLAIYLLLATQYGS
ncbi:MAG: prepilin peptidase [Paracoccaceae bacterium]|jgi:prepilin peptidase CpaA